MWRASSEIWWNMIWNRIQAIKIDSGLLCYWFLRVIEAKSIRFYCWVNFYDRSLISAALISSFLGRGFRNNMFVSLGKMYIHFIRQKTTFRYNILSRTPYEITRTFSLRSDLNKSVSVFDLTYVRCYHKDTFLQHSLTE